MANESLNSIKDKLEIILESTNIATWDWYIQVDRAMWDDSCFEMLGYEPKEFMVSFKKWLSLVHPDDQERCIKEVEEKVANGETFFMEFRLKTKDNNWLWIEGRGKVVEYDSDGKPLRVSGVHINIDEKKRSILKIKEQENIFQEVFNTAPVGITITDPVGNIIDCNKASEKLLGITREEHLNRDYDGKYWKIIRPDGSEMPASEYASVRALEDQKLINDSEMGIVHNSGEVTWLSVSAKPSSNEDIGVVIAYKEITKEKENTLNLEERVKEELLLREKSEKSYKTIFENSPEGLLLIDEYGTFTECNNAAAEFLNLDPKEIIGKTFVDFSTPMQKGFNSSEVGFNYLNRAFNGEVVVFEWNCIGFNEREVTLEVQLAPYGDSSSELIVFWRDLTKMKKLQEEKVLQDSLIIQQSKLAEMGEMVGAIAHQWKQPLNTIYLLVDNIVDSIEYDDLTPEMTLEIVENIKKQAKFMNDTINDFRKFMIPTKEKRDFKFTSTLNDIFKILKFKLLNHNIEISIDIEKDFKLHGIENEFKQVMLNILNNATDALDESDKTDKIIKVFATVEDEKGIIKIEDNGGGIEPSLLPEKLFNSYVSTKGENGTGVGLQLVKKILIEHFKGNVKAYNSNFGACFEITVPCKGEIL